MAVRTGTSRRLAARKQAAPQPAAARADRRLPSLRTAIIAAAAYVVAVIFVLPYLDKPGKYRSEHRRRPSRWDAGHRGQAADLHERVRRPGRGTPWLLPPDPDQIVVIHDELDLPFGTISLKRGGGDNGHNGLRSTTSALGTPGTTTGYGRHRSSAGMDPAAFVLR